MQGDKSEEYQYKNFSFDVIRAAFGEIFDSSSTNLSNLQTVSPTAALSASQSTGGYQMMSTPKALS